MFSKCYFQPDTMDPELKIMNDESSNQGLMPKKTDGDLTPLKKKRNSYADSPHKLSCPHCPRSFPWVSSLKRHLLTHTGNVCKLLVVLNFLKDIDF